MWGVTRPLDRLVEKLGERLVASVAGYSRSTDEQIDMMIHRSSLICAGFNLVPLPLLGFSSHALVHAAMARGIAGLTGARAERGDVREVARLLGRRYLWRQGKLAAVRFGIPIAGPLLALSSVYAWNHGLGKMTQHYYRLKREGRPIDRAGLLESFETGRKLGMARAARKGVEELTRDARVQAEIARRVVTGEDTGAAKDALPPPALVPKPGRLPERGGSPRDTRVTAGRTVVSSAGAGDTPRRAATTVPAEASRARASKATPRVSRAMAPGRTAARGHGLAQAPKLEGFSQDRVPSHSSSRGEPVDSPRAAFPRPGRQSRPLQASRARVPEPSPLPGKDFAPPASSSRNTAPDLSSAPPKDAQTGKKDEPKSKTKAGAEPARGDEERPRVEAGGVAARAMATGRREDIDALFPGLKGRKVSEEPKPAFSFHIERAESPSPEPAGEKGGREDIAVPPRKVATKPSAGTRQPGPKPSLEPVPPAEVMAKQVAEAQPGPVETTRPPAEADARPPAAQEKSSHGRKPRGATPVSSVKQPDRPAHGRQPARRVGPAEPVASPASPTSRDEQQRRERPETGRSRSRGPRERSEMADRGRHRVAGSRNGRDASTREPRRGAPSGPVSEMSALESLAVAGRSHTSIEERREALRRLLERRERVRADAGKAAVAQDEAPASRRSEASRRSTARRADPRKVTEPTSRPEVPAPRETGTGKVPAATGSGEKAARPQEPGRVTAGEGEGAASRGKARDTELPETRTRESDRADRADRADRVDQDTKREEPAGKSRSHGRSRKAVGAGRAAAGVPATQAAERPGAKVREEEEPGASGKEDVAPVEKEDVAPVEKEDVAPVEKEDVAPVEKEDVAPVEKEDVAPVEKEDVAPVEKQPSAAGDGSKASRARKRTRKPKSSQSAPPRPSERREDRETAPPVEGGAEGAGEEGETAVTARRSDENREERTRLTRKRSRRPRAKAPEEAPARQAKKENELGTGAPEEEQAGAADKKKEAAASAEAAAAVGEKKTSRSRKRGRRPKAKSSEEAPPPRADEKEKESVAAPDSVQTAKEPAAAAAEEGKRDESPATAGSVTGDGSGASTGEGPADEQGGGERKRRARKRARKPRAAAGDVTSSESGGAPAAQQGTESTGT